MMKQRILGIPPHLSLILSLMLLTFYVVDRFNTAMAFINHPMTKALIGALVLFDLLSAVRLFLLKDRIVCAGWGLLSLAGAGVLLFDCLYPDRILFTLDSVKLLLCILAVASHICAVYLIVRQRKATLQATLQ